jgi:PEP-CTERM motif
MKTFRFPAAFVALPTLSLAAFLPMTAHAASIVRIESWMGRLPEAKSLNTGAVTLKRPAVNHWVRFDAPAGARRGMLTLSSGTLQSIKSGTLDLAIRHMAQSFTGTLTITDAERIESPMINFDVSSADNGEVGTFTLASSQDFQFTTASPSPLPIQEFDLPNFAGSGNLDSLVTSVTSNPGSVVAPARSETVAANPAAIPVPEPTAVALSALSIVGMFARRRR